MMEYQGFQEFLEDGKRWREGAIISFFFFFLHSTKEEKKEETPFLAREAMAGGGQRLQDLFIDVEHHKSNERRPWGSTRTNAELTAQPVGIRVFRVLERW